MLRLRAVLALPGMVALYGSMFLGRAVGSCGPMLITLYTVTTLGQSYTQAGWVNSVLVIGMGVGAPLAGWALDHGRGWLLVGATAVIEAGFWLSAGHLGYVALLLVASVTATFVLPTNTLPRWVIATRMDESNHQAAYTLDSICSEISYMVGPPLAVLLATHAGASPALAALGGLTLLVGFAFLKTVQTPDLEARGSGVANGAGLANDTPKARSALRAAAGPFVLVGAAMTMLAATEVLLIALMRSRHELSHLSVLVLVWCASSVVGALAFAADHLWTDPTILFGLMAVCSTLIGLASSWWQAALLLIPTGFFNAPVLSASSLWLSRIAPRSLRGRVMGWQTSAMTVGLAIGSPAGGLLADRVALWLSFCLLGLFGLLGAIVAAVVGRPQRSAPAIAADLPVTQALGGECECK